MLFVLVPSEPIKDRGNPGQNLEITDTKHLTTEEGAQAVMKKMMEQMALAAKAKGGQ